MKNIISYGLFSLLLVMGACRKSDNPKIPTLTRVPVPNLAKSSTGDQALSVSTPTSAAAFSANFSVGLKFPDDVKPSKMDVVVRKNSNNTNVKVYQAGITTWPTTINVTGAKLISLFGAPVVLGDNYEFGVDIYTADGGKFEAFPLVGIPYGSGIAGEYGGTVTSVTYSAICAYDADAYQGVFVVVSDDWADTSPGDLITLTKIDATHFSFKYLSPGTPTLINAVPIIVTVDPASNTPSIAKQIAGTGWTYDNSAPVTVRTTASGSNSVSPCSGGLSLNLAWSQGSGEYPNYILKLKKQ
ncbi:MAG: hypothetical protein ABIP30_14025 [Ferruginibacter sp.]